MIRCSKCNHVESGENKNVSKYNTECFFCQVNLSHFDLPKLNWLYIYLKLTHLLGVEREIKEHKLMLVDSRRACRAQLQFLQPPVPETVLFPVEFSSDDAPTSTACEGVGHG